MSGNRLFNVFVFAALAVLVILTASQAIATSKVVASSSSAENCISASVRTSIMSASSSESQTRVLRINGVATGLEGGLIELLSGQRVCDQ